MYAGPAAAPIKDLLHMQLQLLLVPGTRIKKYRFFKPIIDDNLMALPRDYDGNRPPEKSRDFRDYKDPNRKKNNKIKIAILSFFALVIVVPVIILAIPTDTQESESEQRFIEKYEIVETELISCEILENWVNVQASLTNTDSRIHSFEVALMVYDKNGKMVDFVEDHVYGLSAGETEIFSRMIPYQSSISHCDFGITWFE